MLSNQYSNFVRPSTSLELKSSAPSLSGEDARRIYLEEIKEDRNLVRCNKHTKTEYTAKKSIKDLIVNNISKQDLFMSAQNNDVQTLKQILEICPNMLNTTDDYGWTLLMIACQANSVNVVKELLIRGINISIRDKAGNSAHSLVIQSKNLILADILLSYKTSKPVTFHKNTEDTKQKPKANKNYFCEICNKDFPDKEEHLSSTVHNIDASKSKKIPSSYKIPASNKGYQIMLKVGWDKESGLGPDGSGKKYPIKTVQKKDRKGLGLDIRKKKPQEEHQSLKHVDRKLLEKKSKSMEINFRRQFY